MSQNGSTSVPAVMIEQTMHHLATMVEAFSPPIPPGQAIAVSTQNYRISIQPRLIVAPTGLLPPQC